MVFILQENNYIKGIRLTLLSSIGVARVPLEIGRFSSANDGFFRFDNLKSSDQGCFLAEGDLFLPYSLAMNSKLWFEVGCWLSRDSGRKLRVKVGGEEFEESSILGVMDVLVRALQIYKECLVRS